VAFTFSVSLFPTCRWGAWSEKGPWRKFWIGCFSILWANNNNNHWVGVLHSTLLLILRTNAEYRRRRRRRRRRKCPSSGWMWMCVAQRNGLLVRTYNHSLLVARQGGVSWHDDDDDRVEVSLTEQHPNRPTRWVLYHHVRGELACVVCSLPHTFDNNRDGSTVSDRFGWLRRHPTLFCRISTTTITTCTMCRTCGCAHNNKMWYVCTIHTNNNKWNESSKQPAGRIRLLLFRETRERERSTDTGVLETNLSFCNLRPSNE